MAKLLPIPCFEEFPLVGAALGAAVWFMWGGGGKRPVVSGAKQSNPKARLVRQFRQHPSSKDQALKLFEIGRTDVTEKFIIRMAPFAARLVMRHEGKVVQKWEFSPRGMNATAGFEMKPATWFVPA